MANVNIKFNGKEYLLSCEDGQEEHLEELSSNLSQKFSSLKKSLGNIGENKLLLITSITTMDEYYETKKKLEKQKIEIQNLISKFKELKSLVYNYKDEKEKEILKLSDNQTKLEFEIQNQKNNYENLIDTAAKEIENFIQKNNPDINIQ